MKKIVIITSNQIRHTYFRRMFANSKNIDVLRSYVEFNSPTKPARELDAIEINHFLAREKTEEDFFLGVINQIEDESKPLKIAKGEINEQKYINEIKELKVDYIITFGCCILKKSFLEEFEGKIINVHLGISPYYLGAGTNFHALVNGDFQCTGYTFMFMDEGIDTGEVIHQARAVLYPFDNAHQIGNRLIRDMVNDFIRLISNFELVKPIQNIINTHETIICKIKDANVEKTIALYDSFRRGSVQDYLLKEHKKVKEYPILEQEFMKICS